MHCMEQERNKHHFNLQPVTYPVIEQGVNKHETRVSFPNI